MSSERPKPYVGVSGVVNSEQQAMLREFSPMFHGIGRQLALGVKAVYKTQWLDTVNKFGSDWYPMGEEIRGCLVADREDELRVAQVFFDQDTARQEHGNDYERRFIEKLLGRTGTMFNALQFDLLPWDSRGYTDLFSGIRAARPDMKIIVQAHKWQMQQHEPPELVRRLNLYAFPNRDRLIDYVLFDASHGTETRMDIEELSRFVEAAYRETNFGIGVAGGLSAEVVEHDLPRLLKYHPDLSFDAEGQLHLNENPRDRSLNVAATKGYLAAAKKAIEEAS